MRVENRAGIVEDQVVDGSEMQAMVLLKPCQALAVCSQVECRPLPCPDVTMEASLASKIRAKTAGGVITENQRKRQPYRSRTGSKRLSARGTTAGAADSGTSSSGRLRFGPLSRSSNKAISQKKGIDLRRPKRLDRIIG